MYAREANWSHAESGGAVRGVPVRVRIVLGGCPLLGLDGDGIKMREETTGECSLARAPLRQHACVAAASAPGLAGRRK